jgi:ComF family protein
MDRLVQRFKYAGDLALGRWLAAALADHVAHAPRPDLIVAPPSTRERLRERGFNPGLEIAKAVARHHGLRCAVSGLARARETQPQPGLARGARCRNLEGAFACRIDVNGAHVALVDDVLTTGATADAAADVLKRAGAARVSVWVVARTPQSHV